MRQRPFNRVIFSESLRVNCSLQFSTHVLLTLLACVNLPYVLNLLELDVVMTYGPLQDRILALFGSRSQFNTYDGKVPDDSPFFVEEVEKLGELHDVPFIDGEPNKEYDADTLSNFWLDRPNPTFGGKCPRTFLNGNKEQQKFLSGIISGIEDGTFS